MGRVRVSFSYAAIALIALVLLLFACTTPQDKQANPIPSVQASGTNTDVVIATNSPATTFTSYIVPTALDNRNDANEPFDVVTALPTNYYADQANTPNAVNTPVPSPASANTKAGDKISPDLAKAMSDSPSDISFVVMLSEQNISNDGGADTSKMSSNDMRTYVANKDKALADRTQPAVKAVLDQLQTAGQVKSYESFIIFNGFQVEGTATAIMELAKHDEVGSLDIVHPMYPMDEITQEPSTPTSHSHPGN